MRNWRSAKQYCILFCCTVLLLLGSLLGYVYIFDPWQLFHKPWFRDPVFIKNARFQNSGIINSYDFDSAIIGNSMAENFSAAEASRLLGGRFVNLAMSGSLYSERSIVLEHLFRKKDIKTVVVTLDHLPYVWFGQFHKKYPAQEFDFLYNNNPFDDFRIYLDVKLFDCWDLKDSCKKKIPGGRKESLEDLYPWFPNFVKAFGGTDNWCYWSKKSKPFKKYLQDKVIKIVDQIDKGKSIPWPKKSLAGCDKRLSATFNGYVLSYIKNNPDTRFYLFFPPYSRLRSGMQERYYTGNYQSYFSYVKFVVEATEQYPNVSVFGFDDQDFTGDLANYKDLIHYHRDINSLMLERMSARSNILTSENVDSYLARVSKLAHNYDLHTITNAFKDCLPRKK